MNRTLAAAALAAVMLPAAALEASARPAPATVFGKTYFLQCQANANDGVALKVRIMVKNTSWHVIKKGTPIALRYVVRYAPGTRPQVPLSQTQIAYRDVNVNDSIGFDQPKGVIGCRASATLRPDIQTKIKAAR